MSSRVQDGDLRSACGNSFNLCARTILVIKGADGCGHGGKAERKAGNVAGPDDGAAAAGWAGRSAAVSVEAARAALLKLG